MPPTKIVFLSIILDSNTISPSLSTIKTCSRSDFFIMRSGEQYLHMFSRTSITILWLEWTILTEMVGLCESDTCSNVNKDFPLYLMLLGLFVIKLLPINNVKVILYV